MVVLGALGVVAGEAEHTAAAAKAKKQYMYYNTSKPVSPDGQVGKLADISHSIRPVGAAAVETPTTSVSTAPLVLCLQRIQRPLGWPHGRML